MAAGCNREVLLLAPSWGAAIVGEVRGRYLAYGGQESAG
jgi:hypothetical protein